MSALFGYTGPQVPGQADAMAAALRHRGNRRTHIGALECAVIGYGAHGDPRDEELHGAGWVQDGKRGLAVAGIIRDWPDGVSSLSGLLERLARDGSAAIEALRGQFVLAWFDGTRLTLARDRAGERTLYYGLHNDRLYFAVEPKGILAVRGFPRRIRPGGVAQFLTYSFQPGERTMLEDIYEVPPGHTVTFDGKGAPTLHRYFLPEHGTDNGAWSPEAWTAHFRETFNDAVAERLRTDEPVAVFLSGGIDSSAVTAEVARQYPGRVRTYAIHFGRKYPHELDYARMVAERWGTEHEEVYIEPKGFLPRLREIIWHLDDPIGDPVTVPNFELARHVARDVRWVFNGEGGDPCFGGPKNLPMMLHHWYGVERGQNFRERLYLASYRRGYEELARLLSPEMQRQIDPARDLEGILTPFFNATHPSRLLDKLIAINIRLKGAHLILPKVERMTGAFGLTPLAPLFDDRMVRLAFALPSQLKLSQGVEKVILKRAFASDLPDPVIKRPKSGMRVPVHYWLQGEMRRYAHHILSKKRIEREGIFHWPRVKQLLAYNTEEGPGRYGLRLWMLITFEIWRRIVVEGEPV